MKGLEALRHRFMQASIRAASQHHIVELQMVLQQFIEEYDVAAHSKEGDLHELAASRWDLASTGLEIQQRIIPLLHELSETMLQKAGKEAVEKVVSGYFVDGKQRPSGYTMPAQFSQNGIVDKVKETLRR